MRKILFVLLMAAISACQTQTAPVQTGVPPTPKAIPVQEAPTPVQPKFDYSVSSNCKIETQSNNGLAEARTTCGGGIYIILNETTFKGGPEDPGYVQKTVSAMHGSAHWNSVSGADALIFFTNQEEARNYVCKLMNNGYMLMLGSEWVLGGVKCSNQQQVEIINISTP